MQDYSAIVNIHSEDKLYTEVPRLVMAALNGKVVVSEKLSSEFIKGFHYMDIDNFSTKNIREIYNNFSKFTSSKYSFYNYLKSALRQ